MFSRLIRAPEHFGGKWPFWISPRQILIVPVMPSVHDYVEELQKILQSDKLNVDIDVSGNTLQKKIRTGQLAQYNFILGKPYFSLSSAVEDFFELNSFLTSFLTNSGRCSGEGVAVGQHS